MHGLVGDELFQERGRGVPGDRLQIEETHVEPAGQQGLHVRRQGRETGMAITLRKGPRTQVDHELDPVRQARETGQELRAGCAQGRAQGTLGRAPVGLVFGRRVFRHRLIEPAPIDSEFLGQDAQKARLRGGVQTEIELADAGRAPPRGDLAAAAVQTIADLRPERLDTLAVQSPGVLVLFIQARALGDLAPRRHQIVEGAVEYGRRVLCRHGIPLHRNGSKFLSRYGD